MKEATGGTMMLYIFLVFLAVYITFIAVAFNYARAFRIKNEIVDIIEQHEGIENFADNTGIKGTIATFLDKVKYKIPSFDGEKDCKGYDYIDSRGYCIKEYDSGDSVRGDSYYAVRTFTVISIPFANINFKVPVNGETRVVIHENDYDVPDSSASETSSADCSWCDEALDCIKKNRIWDNVNKVCNW